MAATALTVADAAALPDGWSFSVEAALSLSLSSFPALPPSPPVHHLLPSSLAQAPSALLLLGLLLPQLLPACLPASLALHLPRFLPFPSPVPLVAQLGIMKFSVPLQ